MLTETELKIKGLEALTSILGAVNAEKFISLILKEPFDYTKWQRKLWRDKTIEVLSSNAMQFQKEQK